MKIPFLAHIKVTVSLPKKQQTINDKNSYHCD